MEPILRALEAAHRATLREYPRQALQLVEELGQSTLGGDTLDSMRTKGLSAFELWVLDTAKARIPVALNTGEMQEALLEVWSSLLDNGVGFVSSPMHPPQVFWAVAGAIINKQREGPRHLSRWLNSVFAEVWEAVLRAAATVIPSTLAPDLALREARIASLLAYKAHQLGPEPTPEEDLVEELCSMRLRDPLVRPSRALDNKRARRMNIPSLSGRGWGKFEADPDAVDRLAPHGKRCIKHALRLCLDRVFRGFPNAKKPIDATTNYLLSNHSIWSLIASARALDPNSSPEVVIVEVETFFALISVFHDRHPYKMRAVEDWVAGWAYPLLEMFLQAHARTILPQPLAAFHHN
ncbi:hypothetical protein B0H13DRAFT_2664706 [Mycena leptocephala]|nr:hypothetical protein B0H13DRAFT_2664706 [Mycena leptocephala]